MITSDSKLLFGIGGVAAVLAIAYAIGSGDRMGAITLAAAAAASVFLGAFVVGRAPTPAAAAAPAPLPSRESNPVASSPWPMAAGIAAVLLAVAFAIDIPAVVLGLVAVACTAAAWFVTVWREDPDADPAAEYAEERVIAPAGLPILGLAGIAVVVIAVSRILLAVPKEASTAIAIAAAAAIFVGGIVVSARSRVSGSVLAGLLVLVAGLLVAGGVVAAANGEREIEHHPGSTRLDEVAQGTAFTKKQLTAVGPNVAIEFVNRDEQAIHNISVYTDESAKQDIFFGDAIVGLGKRTYVFRAQPGTYFYRCEFHPTQMTGTLVVKPPSAAQE